MVEANRIGKGLMGHDAVQLVLANPGCDMCLWLERGHQTAEEGREVEAYATEILLHRRSFHIPTADHVN